MKISGLSRIMSQRIVDVRYMTKEEQELLGIYSRGIIIQLANGILLFPMRDDEGNDAGALFTSDEEIGIFGTLRD